MKPYRKRAMESWNAGKRGKQNSDPAERQFAKLEIEKAKVEMDADYFEKYRGRRTRNIRARLEHRIFWIGQHLANYPNSYSRDYFRAQLEKDQKKLADLLAKIAMSAVKS